MNPTVEQLKEYPDQLPAIIQRKRQGGTINPPQ